jgi:hypothetical protein
MDAEDRDELISLARAAVSSLAPEELPVFDAVSERCVRDPERGLRIGRTRDDVLGFGIDAIVPLLTPVAIAVAAEVLRSAILRLARARRGSAPAHAPETAWRPTAEQFGELHDIAYRKALAARLPDPRATALADAVVAALAMARD